MSGWMRLVPAVALLLFAVALAAMQPWVKNEHYSVTGNITDLSGWSTLSPDGRLLLHLSVRDAISDPRVVSVNLGGNPCANVSGNLASHGETDIHADCSQGTQGAPYNGTITMSYLKDGTEFKFDYRVIGIFTGWRA